MQHINVLDAAQLVKIMQGFTMVGQTDIVTARPMHIGERSRARAAVDIANCMDYPLKICMNWLLDYYKNGVTFVMYSFICFFCDYIITLINL